MLDFLSELVIVGFKFVAAESTIKCKAFEDNKGALEMAHSPKLFF
jgi:hypothetical protein